MKAATCNGVNTLVDAYFRSWMAWCSYQLHNGSQSTLRSRAATIISSGEVRRLMIDLKLKVWQSIC
jgi:hypothetical protein